MFTQIMKYFCMLNIEAYFNVASVLWYSMFSEFCKEDDDCTAAHSVFFLIENMKITGIFFIFLVKMMEVETYSTHFMNGYCGRQV